MEAPRDAGLPVVKYPFSLFFIFFLIIAGLVNIVIIFAVGSPYHPLAVLVLYICSGIGWNIACDRFLGKFM